MGSQYQSSILYLAVFQRSYLELLTQRRSSDYRGGESRLCDAGSSNIVIRP